MVTKSIKKSELSQTQNNWTKLETDMFLNLKKPINCCNQLTQLIKAKCLFFSELSLFMLIRFEIENQFIFFSIIYFAYDQFIIWFIIVNKYL